jgi:hypothetical protein
MASLIAWRFAMTTTKSTIRRIGNAATAAAFAFCPEISRADESDASFWPPEGDIG